MTRPLQGNLLMTSYACTCAVRMAWTPFPSFPFVRHRDRVTGDRTVPTAGLGQRSEPHGSEPPLRPSGVNRSEVFSFPDSAYAPLTAVNPEWPCSHGFRALR